jgi:hypothetical protein
MFSKKIDQFYCLPKFGVAKTILFGAKAKIWGGQKAAEVP